MRTLTIALAVVFSCQSAFADDDAASETARGFRARLSGDGLLATMFSGRDATTGKVAPVEQVRVKLIQRGRIVASSTEVIDGVVQLKDIAPGTYSLIATAPEGYVSAGLQVLPAATFDQIEAADGEAKRELTTTGVHVFLVSRDDYRAVAGFFKGGQPAEAAGVGSAADAVSEEPFESGVLSPFRRPVLTIQTDGRAYGRIFNLDAKSGRDTAVSSARLAIVRDGRIVSTAVTDANGRYELRGLTPGPYTLATAAETGFSAFGVAARLGEATAAKDVAPAKVDSEGRRFVQFDGPVVGGEGFSETVIGGPVYDGGFIDGGFIDGGYADPCCCVEHAVICEDAIPFEPLCGEVIYEDVFVGDEFLAPPAADAFAPYGGAGFGGGFGAGGVGGGGIGGLLAGAAAGGLIGYAISEADDDDDRGGDSGAGGQPISPMASESEED